MKKLILPVLLVVFGCLFLHSCKDKSTFEDYQVSLGYEYFPLEVGKYRDYIVDSTTYDIGPNEVVIILNSTTYVREAVPLRITLLIVGEGTVVRWGGGERGVISFHQKLPSRTRCTKEDHESKKAHHMRE